MPGIRLVRRCACGVRPVGDDLAVAVAARARRLRHDATNTLIQGIVADAMRGRVMAYYVMSFIGIVPVSSLLAGWISHEVGAPLTLAAGGILCVAAATGMWILQLRSRVAGP